MAGTVPPGAAPEGWYDDPWRPGAVRWWNGSEWTDHTSPAPPREGPDGEVRPSDGAVDARREPPADVRLRMWAVIIGGVVVLLIGALLELSDATSVHGVATVLKEGPCAISGDAGRVCDERVSYRDGGRTVVASMHGVHPDEVHGPPGHRTLAITFQHGDTDPPATDDMPLGVPIGLGAAGALLVIWGLVLRRGRRRAAQVTGGP